MCKIQSHLTSPGTHAILKEEKAEAWKCPGLPSDLHCRDTNPAHTALELWRGNMGMAEKAQAVWCRSPPSMLSGAQVHTVLWQCHGHCFPASILPQPPFPQKHWEMVLALEHNSPQTLILKKVIFMKAENPNCLDPKYLMTPKEQSPPPYKWCRICVDGPVKRGAWVDLKSL